MWAPQLTLGCLNQDSSQDHYKDLQLNYDLPKRKIYYAEYPSLFSPHTGVTVVFWARAHVVYKRVSTWA